MKTDSTDMKGRNALFCKKFLYQKRLEQISTSVYFDEPISHSIVNRNSGSTIHVKYRSFKTDMLRWILLQSIEKDFEMEIIDFRWSVQNDIQFLG